MADATEPGLMGLGLLQGVDVATASKYSEALTYSADLLTEQGFFWSAAEADAQSCGKSVEDYLAGLTTKFFAFMSSDYVFDRDGLKNGIRGLITKEANLSIVLGAKSIGKTMVFQAVNSEFTNNESDVMVVYVNAREVGSGSLAKGIQLALKRLDKMNFFKEINWGEVRSSLANSVGLHNEKAGKAMTEINGLLDALNLCGNVDNVDDDVNFVELIIAMAEGKGKRPCLIIDEANLCLNGGEHEDAIVSQFLNRTKETKKLNIILCSSKHSFPEQLERSGLQLGIVNLVQAEEPSPFAVWNFLTQEKKPGGDHIIGMGNELAKLCIALAGGNVMLISKAVEKLAERKDRFTGSQLVKSIEGALWVEGVIDDEDARLALEDLAKVGYAVASKKTRSLLVGNSIAGLLTADFTMFTDMERIVIEHDEVLVPSSAGLRNRISFELHKAKSGEDVGRSDTSSPRHSS